MNKASVSVSVYKSELFEGRPIHLDLSTFLGLGVDTFDLISSAKFQLSKKEAARLVQLLKLELLDDLETCNFCEMLEGLSGTYCESCEHEFGTA